MNATAVINDRWIVRGDAVVRRRVDEKMQGVVASIRLECEIGVSWDGEMRHAVAHLRLDAKRQRADDGSGEGLVVEGGHFDGQRFVCGKGDERCLFALVQLALMAGPTAVVRLFRDAGEVERHRLAVDFHGVFRRRRRSFGDGIDFEHGVNESSK